MAETKTANDTFVRDAIQECVDAVRRPVSGVREGDTEAIQQLFDAARRLRVALRVFAPCLSSGDVDTLAQRMTAIIDGLGHVRELDALLGLLVEWQEDYHPPWAFAAEHAAGALRKKRGEEAAAMGNAAGLIAGEAFGATTGALLASCNSAALGNSASVWLMDAIDDVCRQYEAWRDSREVEELEALRASLLDLRDASDLVLPLHDKKLKKYAKSLRSLLDDLDEWHVRHRVHRVLDELAPGADYRSAQGYPELIRDAAEESEDAAKSFRKAAKKIFGKGARKKSRKVFEYEVTTEEIETAIKIEVVNGSNGTS